MLLAPGRPSKIHCESCLLVFVRRTTEAGRQAGATPTLHASASPRVAFIPAVLARRTKSLCRGPWADPARPLPPSVFHIHLFLCFGQTAEVCSAAERQANSDWRVCLDAPASGQGVSCHFDGDGCILRPRFRLACSRALLRWRVVLCRHAVGSAGQVKWAGTATGPAFVRHC